MNRFHEDSKRCAVAFVGYIAKCSMNFFGYITTVDTPAITSLFLGSSSMPWVFGSIRNTATMRTELRNTGVCEL